MDNLINSIAFKYNSLFDYEFKAEEELLFLKEIYNMYNINYKNILNLRYLKNSNFLIAILSANKLITYNEARSLIKPITKLIDDMNVNELSCRKFINTVKEIYKNGPDNLKKLDLSTSPFNNNDFLKLIFKVDSTIIFDCFVTLLIIKNYCIETFPDEHDNNKVQISQKKKLMVTLSKVSVYPIFYRDSFGSIKRRIDYLEKTKSTQFNKIKKLHKAYDTILSEIKKDSVINYMDNFSEIDEDLLFELLHKSLIHNERFYIEETNQYLLNLNNSNNLEQIFQDNNFNINLLTKENYEKLIKYGKPSNIRSILSIIRNKPFCISQHNDNFIDLLLCSNSDILNYIKDLENKKIIDQSFIYNNFGILLSEEYQSLTQSCCLYETLFANIDLFQMKQFNLTKIKKFNPSLFLQPPQELKQHIYILEQYGIDFSKQSNTFYQNLMTNNLFIIIDRFIELGLHNYIKENLELILEDGNNIIKRIYISKLIDFNIWDENNKLSSCIMTGYQFFVKNNDLDNFIINNNGTDYALNSCLTNNNFCYSNIINTLDKLFLNNEDYYFNNIIISRNKVIRNISNITGTIDMDENNIKNVLLTAIIHNSILDNDQINIIENIINKLIQKKSKTLSLQ